MDTRNIDNKQLPASIRTVLALAANIEDLKQRPTPQILAKINELSDALPEYNSLLEDARKWNVIVDLGREATLEDTLWEATGLPHLVVEAFKLQNNDALDVQDEYAPEAGDYSRAIRSMISKGYAGPSSHTNHSYPAAMAQLDIFPFWAEHSGPEKVENLMIRANLSPKNLLWVINKVGGEPSKRVLGEICENLTTFKNEPMEALRPHFVAVGNIRPKWAGGQVPALQYDRLCINAMLHPEWAKALFGPEPKSVRSFLPSIDKALVAASGRPGAWDGSSDYLGGILDLKLEEMLVSSRDFHSQVQSCLEEVKDPEVMKCLINRPALREMPLMICDSLWNRNLGKHAGKIAEMLSSRITLAPFAFESILFSNKDGAVIPDNVVKQLVLHTAFHPDEETSPEFPLPASSARVIVRNNRPELLKLADPRKINWSQVGVGLPADTITISGGEAKINNDRWEEALTGPYLDRAVAGNIGEKLVCAKPVEFFHENRDLLAKLDFSDAVLENDLLKRIAQKSNVHQALQMAVCLKLDRKTMSSEKHKEFNLLVAKSGKIGHVQQFVKLGGEITDGFIQAVVSSKKPPILDFVVHNSKCAISSETVKRYLSASNDLDATSLTLMGRASFDNPVDMLQELQHFPGEKYAQARAEAYQHIVKNSKIPPQELFDLSVAEFADAPKYRYGDEEKVRWLTSCVMAGADHKRPMMKMGSKGLDVIAYSNEQLDTVVDAMRKEENITRAGTDISEAADVEFSL